MEVRVFLKDGHKAYYQNVKKVLASENQIDIVQYRMDGNNKMDGILTMSHVFMNHTIQSYHTGYKGDFRDG